MLPTLKLLLPVYQILKKRAACAALFFHKLNGLIVCVHPAPGADWKASGRRIVSHLKSGQHWDFHLAKPVF